MILVGFPLLVWLSTVATKKFRLHVPASGRAWCFFIYLYHYIPVIALKKVLSGKLLSPYSPDWALAGAHLLNALVVLGALSLVYMLMRKILPRTCRVIIGGK